MNKPDENKALTQRFYNEVMNGHNVSKISTFCSPEFKDHNPSPGHSGKGMDDLISMFNDMFAAFPDLHVTVDLMIAEDDKVVAYLTVTGTNTGPFANMPATNKSVKVNGVDIVRIKDSKAIERWGAFDNMSMMTQLGIMNS